MVHRTAISIPGFSCTYMNLKDGCVGWGRRCIFKGRGEPRGRPKGVRGPSHRKFVKMVSFEAILGLGSGFKFSTLMFKMLWVGFYPPLGPLDFP